MKKMLLFVILILISGGVLFAQFKNGDTAWISSRTVDLKSSSWFFASSKGSLEMGDQVTVLRTSGSWAEVRSAANSALSGWTAVSNLSARRIVASGTGASASEIALAGKGFNQEVEDLYRAQGNLNYADVDRTEAITVSMDELYRFITEGRLNTGD